MFEYYIVEIVLIFVILQSMIEGFIKLVCLFVCLFFRTGFLCIALAVLELAFVDQAGLKLRNPPASASRVLGLEACATTGRPGFIKLNIGFCN